MKAPTDFPPWRVLSRKSTFLKRCIKMDFVNLGIMIALGAMAVFSCGMGQLGQVREHREEIGVLKEQSEEEAAKLNELKVQEASFQGVRAAIVSKALQVGTPGKNLIKKFGRPSVDQPEGEGREWLYMARSKKWLETPRVALYFDKENRLKRWECAHTDCGESTAPASR